MKLLAIIITYYPNCRETINNILQFVESVDKLIIWENTPLIDRGKYKISIEGYLDKIIYEGTKINEGIAYPLNWAIKYGLSHGYTHLLTMDQDSQWIDFNMFKNNIELIQSDTIIAYTPFISCINNEFVNEPYTIIKECITSGTVYKLDLCKRNGYFREDYFIDAVDLEYCIRSNLNGFQTVLLPSGKLSHKLGYPLLIFNRWTTSNYSPFRTYHIVRNYIWMWKEYPNQFNKQDYLYRETIIRMLKIILGEKYKLQKILSILKGVYHGFTRKSNCSHSYGNV